MGFYFEDHQSMFAHGGLKVERTLEGVVRRYLGNNPALPLTYRAFDRSGILRGKDYRYQADFAKRFPQAAAGQFVYVWGKIWAEGPAQLKFDLNILCPTVVYCNRQQVYRSDIIQERYPECRVSLMLPLQAGWNHVVLRFKKTAAGFGGIFGTWLGKLPYYFLLPDPAREGQEGWLFSPPLSAELPQIPGVGTTPADTGLSWGPDQTWGAAERKQGQLRRLYGRVAKAYAMGWTKAGFLQAGVAAYTLKGRSRSPLQVFIDGQPVFSTGRAGAFAAKIRVPFGHHDVMVKCDAGARDWGFELSLHDRYGVLHFSSPCNLAGSSLPWIFSGPFAADRAPDFASLTNLDQLAPGLDGDVYWRPDLPDTWVRPYNENVLYGQWNYPLGVTLYGLLHSARAIGSAETQRYIAAHIQACCDIFDYALWDRKQYGGATNVLHLLTSIDSLDDCGSFGSVLLEVAKYCEITGMRRLADYVADYISTRQIRLPDGTFFRKNLMHTFHEDTLWADDLYMSVPFLCRYFELTGEGKYIDDAARQFLGFKRHLYLPKLQVMSHVFDFKRGLATGVPWGRGNGWTIFSLSELLAVLPAKHKLRPELITFFRGLSAGYLALQDAAGMWHQVLNEHDSYPETSCTSMFAYAFARGIQFGWFEEPDPYIRSVFRAWEALNRTSIDQKGNVHGVCRGSEFCFTSDYYKHELLWNLNDTHGIGIVLLAGVEVRRLMERLKA